MEEQKEELIEIIARYPFPSNPNWVNGSLENRKYNIKMRLANLRDMYIGQGNLAAGWALEQIEGLAIAIKNLESSHDVPSPRSFDAVLGGNKNHD